ncbi:hypothetical protein ACFCV8_25690 [Streptomyces sp. NPDC056347]|uniref:hypothetical protein n=1 Tax=Streptomyces sp. NPDC056347 TaxID=3345790 RepID=UPI0035E34AA5
MSTEAQRAPVPPRPTTPPTGQAPAAQPSPEAPADPPAPARPDDPPAAAPVPSPETTARLRPVAPAPAPPASVPPVRAVPPAAGARPVPGQPPVPGARPVPEVPPVPEAPPVPGQPPAATRRRPVGAVDLTPPPGAEPRPGPYVYPRPFVPPHPETPAETTTRLRPIRTRHPARTAAAAVCVVLGLGLIGGAVTGAWLTSDSSADDARGAYAVGRSAWHSVPVDTLFPRTLRGDGAGPGGADRIWTRLAVAPDGGCRPALDPLLARTLGPVGCERLVRATYVDATTSSVTTVGVVFTEGDAAAMKALGARFADQRLDRRTDLMPRAYPVKGTAAAGFGDRQRASWTVHVLTEVPVVVFAVSGFADGRTVTDPQPAAAAMAAGARTAAAEAGLGNEAKGIADRIERGLRRTVTDLMEKPE